MKEIKITRKELETTSCLSGIKVYGDEIMDYMVTIPIIAELPVGISTGNYFTILHGEYTLFIKIMKGLPGASEFAIKGDLHWN